MSPMQLVQMSGQTGNEAGDRDNDERPPGDQDRGSLYRQQAYPRPLQPARTGRFHGVLHTRQYGPSIAQSRFLS